MSARTSLEILLRGLLETTVEKTDLFRRTKISSLPGDIQGCIGSDTTCDTAQIGGIRGSHTLCATGDADRLVFVCEGGKVDDDVFRGHVGGHDEIVEAFVNIICCKRFFASVFDGAQSIELFGVQVSFEEMDLPCLYGMMQDGFDKIIAAPIFRFFRRDMASATTKDEFLFSFPHIRVMRTLPQTQGVEMLQGLAYMIHATATGILPGDTDP